MEHKKVKRKIHLKLIS